MLMQNVPTDELSEYKEFAIANPGLTLSQYAWMQLSPDLFVGTVEILTPVFLRHKGGLFFASSFSESRFDEWYQQYNGQINKVEQFINHKHVRSIIQFQPTHSIITVKFIANLLRKFWLISIAEQFPGLDAVIDINDDAEERDCIITIYQK